MSHPEPELIPAQAWFRSLPKPAQWAFGLPLLAAAAWHWIYEAGRVPAPGEPQLAFLETLIILVVAIVLAELLRPKPNFEDARPAGLGDFNFPTATEGRPVQLFWGRNRVKGPNVVWYGDLSQDAITEKVKTGLWSSETITKGYRYNVGVQMVVGRGPGAVMKRVWVGEKQAWPASGLGTVVGGGRFDIDEPTLLGGDDFGTGGIRATVDFYSGEQSGSQSVSPYLDDPDRQRVTAALTPTAPRYVGTSYLVLRELTSQAPQATDRGAYVGNSTSIAPWSFEVERFPALFSGQNAGDNLVGSADCNPANVLYELLTNTEWGFGLAASSIDVGFGSSFEKASASMKAEANGFSMVLDRALSAKQLKTELERQMGGVVYQNPRTGKWTIQLAREATDPRWGYNILTVPELTDDQVITVEEFTRGTWEDTTNQIQVKFNKRDDDYKESYALAQDHANAIILAGGSTLTPAGSPAIANYPGIKLAALASFVAWRDLRIYSYPLARATFVVNREQWDYTIGMVFAWTNPRLGFSRLPMRVTRVEYGTLSKSQMRIQAMQDVFTFIAAAMGTPPPTGWTPPSTALQAYPTDEQFAIEAPRALIVRDPKYGGDPTVGKVWCGARRQVNETAFEIYQRNASGVPGGAFAPGAGTVLQFLRIGALDANLNAGSQYPLGTITINSTPDSQTRLEEVFDDSATPQDLGVDLVHLIKINDEFMLVRSAQLGAGSDVDLQNVYRGVLDSAQQNHLAGDDVLLLFVGGGLTDTVFPSTNTVDVEIRMRSAVNVFGGAVTFIRNTLSNRPSRPYAPAALLYNGSSSIFGTPNMEGDGSGLNGVGFDVDWRRRRFETTDEVQELLQDNTPVAANTEHRVTVFVDPAGANVQVFQSAWVSGTGPELPTQALIVNEAIAGTTIRVQVEARHDFNGLVQIESRHDLIHDVAPTSSRTSQFYLGGDLSSGVASAIYDVATSGVHTVRIGAGYSTADVEIQINGGGWSDVITAGGGASGTTPSLTAGDDVELRVNANESPARNFVEIEDPLSAAVAYGVFTDGT